MNKVMAFLFAAAVLLGGCFFWLGGQKEDAKPLLTVQSVTDSTGRMVEIPARPQRVVLLNASNLDLFCAAGGAAQVVGKPTSKALSAEVQSAVADVPEVGIIHSPNLEKILSLKPDLVIGANVPYHRDLIPVLEKAGIPVLIQAIDTYEQVLSTLEFYGQLLGTEQQAAERIANIQAEYAAAIALGKDKTAPRNLIIFGTPDSFNMGTEKCFVGDLVARLGGNNIASAAAGGEAQFVPLSMEAVAKQNPEVIFLIMHGAPEMLEQRVQQDLLKKAAWADIDAVKNQRVYVLPYQLFAVNPGVQVAAAIQTLAGYLYQD